MSDYCCACWCSSKYFLNGSQLSFDVSPVIKNGTTLVPLRAIFEPLGGIRAVGWDNTDSNSR